MDKTVNINGRNVPVDQALLTKFRVDDELKLEMNPNDWDVQREVANWWVKTIGSYEALNPEMADFASREVAKLFASQNLSFSEALMSKEERFCNILGKQADMEGGGLTGANANVYIEQCLPRKLVGLKVGKEI